jgi:hypothetical protein
MAILKDELLDALRERFDVYHVTKREFDLLDTIVALKSELAVLRTPNREHIADKLWGGIMDANELEMHKIHDERKLQERRIELRARRMAILETIREGSEWGKTEVHRIEDDLKGPIFIRGSRRFSAFGNMILDSDKQEAGLDPEIATCDGTTVANFVADLLESTDRKDRINWTPKPRVS